MNKRMKLTEPEKKNKVENNLSKTANKKVFFLLFFLGFLFIAIVLKLLYINVFQGEDLTRKALNQLTKTELVRADRGIIYDRNKKELAVNVTKANVFYNMNFEKSESQKTEEFNIYKRAVLEEASEKIATVLEVSKEEILDIMVGDKIIKIASNISREKALELKDLKIPRLSIEDVARRFYPYDAIASHVIGFISDDGVGQYGLEAKYDDELSGIAGKNISIKNNSYTQIPLTDEENYAPKEGAYPVLTLDETIQQFAEEAALDARIKHNADMVSIIVQNTVTGEILAMANNRSYNANNPKAPVGEEQEKIWPNLSKEEKAELWFENWINFCVSSQYEPGSVMKVITAAAALEENTTSPLKIYYCPPVLPGTKIICNTKNIGNKTMEQAMAESCNITFVKIGRELGAEKLLKYIKAFGFGEKTGIDLPAEIKGQIPANANEIGDIRLATLSYGHGIAVTPIQLINSVSAIVNGGNLNTPKIVDRFEDKNGNVIKKFKTELKRKVISEETSNTMKRLMKKVVDDGTGRLARVPGYQIGGKTGTAYIPSKDGGYEDNYISSFVGVAPINDPKITVLVVMQRPRGDFYAATVVVPAAQYVLKNTLEYLNIPKTEKIDTSDNRNIVEVPDVTGLLLSDAGKKIVDVGLQFNANINNISNASIVMKQYPEAGAMVNLETIVDLSVNSNIEEDKVMPNLVGKTEKELKTILKDLNVEYNIKGTGEVTYQSVGPNSKINSNTFVVFTMSIPPTDENIRESKNDENNKKNSNKEK